MNASLAPSESEEAIHTMARRLPPWAWLCLGVAFSALAGNRFNVGVLGWVASVPLLIHLRHTSGWRARLWLLGALQLGHFLNVLKIITEPIPWFFAPMFSVPSATTAFVAFLLFEGLRRQLGDRWGVALFPALVVGLEWLGATGSEMGSWGALAYTQLGNPALLQLASVFGLAGIGALLAATSGLLAVLLDSRGPERWMSALIGLAIAILAAHAYGAWRLDRVLPGPSVAVGTVTSDIGMTPEGLPPDDVLKAGTEQLFDRTRLAIAQGAKLVVWNEGATAVTADTEPALLQRAGRLAQDTDTDIVLAYVLPLDGMARFENKYVWVGPEGIVETYFKHHPVPGEGSVRGEDPIQVWARPYGRAGGAICYDYDFPALGQAHARQDAGLVVVPSSDWRGIDPFHTQMAAVRGIEGGFSVVRSVRWATSGAYDAMGRVRGTASWWAGDRVMVAQVPTTRVDTPYSRLGDVLPAGAGLLLVVGIGGAIRRRWRERMAPVS